MKGKLKMFTPKQKRIFDMIYLYEVKHKYPPTLKEISYMIGSRKKPSAISTAQYYIRALEKKGYLKKTPNVERGIELNGQYF